MITKNVHSIDYPVTQITNYHIFCFAELAKRFTKQKSSKKVSGKSLRSKIGMSFFSSKYSPLDGRH